MLAHQHHHYQQNNKMSKLSFRARALDASKPMPILMAEELPDLPDYSAINRAVPQMPSGMQKEEECEHHLQRAICAGLIIPTPEVTNLTDVDVYERVYPADCKLPRQLIHMQPFAMEQDIPDYDMDSEDEKFVAAQRELELTPLQFEDMMDRLEKGAAQKAIKIDEAKELLKEDDDLITAVFDYWLNKRLSIQHPLILTVKTEHRAGTASNNPYLAFRRRTEKMQTRKNRKNDEASYEKMLKLRRDLNRAVTLLDMVKRREKIKREYLHLTIEIFEKRYQAQDFSGQLVNEVSALKAPRPAFTPLFTNQFGVHQNWSNKVCGKEDVPRKEKRQYKKRKHKESSRSNLDDTRNISGSSGNRGNRYSGLDLLPSSDEDSPLPSRSQASAPSDRDDEEAADEGPFVFKRNQNCNYLPPVSGNWPWCSKSEGGSADPRYRFVLASINTPKPRCVGYVRRRMGRGGRVILDRFSNDMDDVWASMDFKIQTGVPEKTESESESNFTIPPDWPHFRPKTPPVQIKEELDDSDIEILQQPVKPKPPEYPFPPEATSICVDFEPENFSDEITFSSEFNLSDYFPADITVSDFDLPVAGPSTEISEQYDEIDWRTDVGCTRVKVLPEEDSVFQPPVRPQCNTNTNSNSVSVNTTINTTATSVCTNIQSIPSNSKVLTQCAGLTTESMVPVKQPRLINNSSIVSLLSKSLTSPSGQKGTGCVKLVSSTTTTTSSAITNFGNGHQNGPITHINNSNNWPLNVHMVNNQPTILLPQKHPPPSNTLPSINKFVNLAKQPQQQQHSSQNKSKNQQIPTTEDITLNSSNEHVNMEVDEVEDSSCDNKTQQQKIVQANKTNSVAMEVT